MGLREFTKSGTFAATVLVLVVVLLPFGLEQIGEATDLFRFPATKTVQGWFAPSAPSRRGPAIPPVDWGRYRQDLEAFTQWSESQATAAISLPTGVVEVIRVVEETRPERRIWPVPVTSCTAGGSAGSRKGYVFISGFEHPYREGATVAPSETLCGYEIVCIGERSVWFRAVTSETDDTPMGVVRFPEFTRVEGESLVKGNRRYAARDAFPLASGGWLMIDSFLPPDGVVFKILDEKRQVVTTLLCVVIGEKGGK